MKNELTVRDIIQSENAISTDLGDKLYEAITPLLRKKQIVILDFEGIPIMTTAFLNAAIGQLFSMKDITSEFLNKHLKLKNVQEEDRYLFKLVITRAKEYFKDKDGFDETARNNF